MAWVTPTLLAVTAAAGLASSAMNASRSPQREQDNSAMQQAALINAQNNQRNQALVQALMNQRSTAGQQDAFGSNIRYDPATNEWISDLGPLPRAAQTAAQQAAVSRNTTDLRAAQFANEQAARRATLAEPNADAARRNLTDFQPMSGDTLTSLLTQRATDAQREVFQPLVADTLRQFARTGTAAGPVLGQIGKDQSKSLRDSLIDAQIKGMGSVDSINQGRKQSLESSAANTSALANPSLQFSGLAGSGADNTLATALMQRAAAAGNAPYYGMAGMNQATKLTNDAFGTAGANLADPNYTLNQLQRGANDLTSLTKPGGSVRELIDYYNKPSTDVSRGATTDRGYQLAAGLNLGQEGMSSSWDSLTPKSTNWFG